MKRSILHWNMDCFYASVECMLNPALKKYPVAAYGSVVKRHGMVILADGQKSEVDRVRHCCRAASTKVVGTGIRYTVSICGQDTFLFDEENGKWFVEAKKN